MHGDHPPELLSAGREGRTAGRQIYIAGEVLQGVDDPVRHQR